MQAAQLRPLSVGEILDVAIKIYWRNAGTLFRLVLIVVAPVQALSALIFASSAPSPAFVTPTPNFQPTPEDVRVASDQLWTFVAGTGVVFILGLVAGTLATAASYKAVTDAYLGEKPDWRTSLRFAFRRFGPVLWVTTLSTLAAIVGFIACFFPGVWLWVSFAIAVPALLTEHVRGTRALSRSYNLIKGRWWPALGLLILGYILAGTVSTVVQGLFAGLLFTGIGENIVASAVLNAVAATLGAMVATPFTAAFITVLYFDLRVRKEGFDLELMAEAVGVAPEAGREIVPPFMPPPSSPAGPQPPYWPPPPGWRPGLEEGEHSSGAAPSSGSGYPEQTDAERHPPYWPPPPGARPPERPGG